jgi:hypothetical protein
MDDKDNRLFGVTAEIAWTQKPAYELTVRNPLYVLGIGVKYLVNGPRMRKIPEHVDEFGHRKSRQHALHPRGGLHARLRNASIQPICEFQRRANCSLMAARPCEGVSRIDHAAEASSPRRSQALLESGKLTTAWISPNPTQQTVVVIVMRQRRRRSRPEGYDRSGRKRAEDHPTHHFFPLR